MKIKALSLAIASVVASQAHALAPSAFDSNTVEIYQSGASAQQNTMEALLTDFCQSGTLDTYADGADDFRNYFCTFKTAGVPASLQGKNVVFYTRATGGSAWGVIPVGKNWNVRFMDLDACSYNGSSSQQTCAITTQSTALLPNGECPTDSADYSSADQDTRCRVSDFGVSDVEPDLFVGNNLNPADGFISGLTSAEAASLTVSANYGVVFGFSVSNNVRDSLIDAGFRIEAPTSGVVAANVVNVGGTDYVANLSKTAIRSVMSGAITNWGQLDPSFANGANDIAFGGFMMSCRRAPGSGTQASAQIQFLDDHSGPKGGSVGMVTEGDSNSDYLVYENSGSGRVEKCQNDANNATSTEVDTFGFNWGAWGINAINRSQSGDSWSFVAIDGTYPTLEAAQVGDYDHMFEQTTQFKTSLSGAKGDFVRLFASEFKKEARIVSSGATGVLALPDASLGQFFPGNNNLVSRVTRGGNSCNSLQIVQ